MRKSVFILEMPGRRRTATQDNQESEDLVGRLADVLERATNQPNHRARQEGNFKAPKFEGTGDVELFIRQFSEVARANEWSPLGTLLHLREALKEGAKDCGRGENVASILAALRAKYGLTPREARTRLTNLRRDPKTSLQEHASEVERLTNAAYADLPERCRTNMIVDTFSMTLGNAYLQRHLLAVGAETIEAAVRAGNEYQQIQPTSNRFGSRSAIMAMEGEDNLVDRPVHVDQASTNSATMDDVLAAIKALTTSLAGGNGRPPSGPRPPPRVNPQARTPGACWECGVMGHVRRQCPQIIRNQPNAPQQGNGYRPQQ